MSFGTKKVQLKIQYFQGKSVRRTKQRVEVKKGLENEVKIGTEVAQELIKASEQANGKETTDDFADDFEEPSQRTEEDEDTVDEAPSIVDEAMSKDSSGSGGSGSKTGKPGQNVTTTPMVNKNTPKEGGSDVIKEDALTDAKEVVATAEPPKPPPIKKPPPISHFKAMALIGKMFLGGPMRRQVLPASSTSTSTTKSETESESESETESETEEESESDDEASNDKEKANEEKKNVPTKEDDFWDTNSEKAKKDDSKDKKKCETTTEESEEEEETDEEESKTSKIELKGSKSSLPTTSNVEGQSNKTSAVDPEKDLKNKEVIKIEAEVHVDATSLNGSTTTTTDPEVVDIDLDDPEVANATTKIQAGFRGHQARKEVEKIRQQKDEEESPTPTFTLTTVDGSTEDIEENAAAIKIQAGFRGSQARKQIKAMKDQEEESSIATSDDTEAYDCSENSSEDDGGVTQIVKARSEMEIDCAATTIQGGYKEISEKDAEVIEEEVDIDLDDPDVANAATKIQAGFRGSQARKEVQEMKQEKLKNQDKEKETPEEVDIDLDDPDVANAATKIQAGFKGHQARKEVQQMKKEKMEQQEKEATEEIDIDLDDPEVADAATKIQAGFKGSQARKEVQKMKQEKIEQEQAATKIQASVRGRQARQEVQEKKKLKNEQDEAATKIQASVRGRKARKEVQEKKKKLKNEQDEAATKIQASVRGRKARKEMNEKKKEMKEKKEKEKETKIDEADPETGSDQKTPAVKEEVAKTEKEKEDTKKDEANPDPKTGNAQPTPAPVEEEVDIDLNDPEVADAAAKIQASFRKRGGLKLKRKQKPAEKKVEDPPPKIQEGNSLHIEKEPSTIDNNTNTKEIKQVPDADDNTEKTTTESREVAKELIDINNEPTTESKEIAKVLTDINEEGTTESKEVAKILIDNNIEDDQATEEAVTTIQTDSSAEVAKILTDINEEVDIDLNDPEVADAATKIQAGFRGSQARKEVAAMKEEDKKDSLNADTTADETLPTDSSAEVAKILIEVDLEDVDIDLDDPEVADAALKIQAGFKGHQARKEVEKMKQEKSEQDETALNADTTVEETLPTDSSAEVAKILIEEDIDIDLEDPEVADAALKIQAGFKGHQARKEVEKMKQEKIEQDETGLNADTTAEETLPTDSSAEVAKILTDINEEIDIDLNDPEVADAATKIQAGFRGSQARKEVKFMKDQEDQKEINEDANNMDHKNRREMQSMDVAQVLIDNNEQDEEAAKKKRYDTKDMENATTESREAAKLLIDIDNEEEEIDIDLEDPEVADAALKIQCSFRGHQARREVESMKNATNKADDGDELVMEMEPENDKSIINDSSLGMEMIPEGPATLDAASTIQMDSSAEVAKILTEEVDIDLNDPEVAGAATKIQAGFRGSQARKEVAKMRHEETMDSVCSIKGSMESRMSIEEDDGDNTIKENLRKSQDNTNIEPVPITNNIVEVKSAHEENSSKPEEAEDPKANEEDSVTPPEEELDDLLDDFTDSSISVSQPSANAPIRNKKVPFTLVKKLVTWIAKSNSKVDPTAAGGGIGKGNNNGNSSRSNSKDKASSSQGSEKSLSLKKRTKVQPIDGE